MIGDPAAGLSDYPVVQVAGGGPVILAPVRLGGWNDRQPRVAPGLEAAFDISRVRKTELLERGRGQARLKALVAQEDDLLIKLRCLRVAVGAGRIQPPFEYVTGNDKRSGDRAVPGDLGLRADIK